MTVVCFKFCVFSYVSSPLILSGVLENCESYEKVLWCSFQKLLVVVVVVVSYLPVVPHKAVAEVSKI